MVQNTHNYWIPRLWKASGIVKTRKHTISETNLSPSSGEGKTPNL
jgi:hypothetical protein